MDGGWGEPGVQPFLRRDAARWTGSLVPWWVPGIALFLSWLLAVTVTAATAPACSPADPSICGPDPVSALAAVGLFSAPLLLWWMPTAGLVAGAGFAVLDTLLDPVAASRATWLAFGVACLLVLWMHAQDVDRQRTLTRAVAGDAGLRLPGGLRPLGWDLRVVLAATLALTGVALLVHHATLVHAEAEHTDRARRVSATSYDWDPATHQAVFVGPDGLPRVVRTRERYEPGRTAPALIDPQDDAWLRLVAEPENDTRWLTGALVLLLLAALTAIRCGTARRSSTSLADRTRPALAVQVDSDGVRTLVYAHDARPEDPPFAVLSTMLAGAPDHAQRAADIDHLQWDSVGHRFRIGRDADAPRERRPGYLVGDVHEGGWPAVLVDDDVLLPATPLRAPRLRPAWIDRVLARTARRT